jgi:N-acetylmuramoyl-L-alanine amidase
LPAHNPRRISKHRLILPALLILGVSAIFWPAREMRSDNFVFYFPTGHHLIPYESAGGGKYLPLVQILNMVGKVAAIEEKKNELHVWFGTTLITLRPNASTLEVDRTTYELLLPVRLSSGQWMVPVDFLTTVLPHLTHQGVEYQDGTNRIFIGDVKPASFTVRVDPIANGARLTVQFTDKVGVSTASSNGRWVMFLGNRPMEPMEQSYRFQNPYLSELHYDDEDGVPKLILTPTSGGLNFYPVQAEGGKILLADVLKPPSLTVQPAPAAPVPAPAPAPATNPQAPPALPLPQITEESPAAPPGPPLPVVALDPGHGGADNGGHSSDGLLEKDLVEQYVARVRAALLATDKYRVVLTRAGDVTTTADQRALAANLSGAVCFISFHAGDLGSSSPRISIFTFQPPSPPPQTPPPGAPEAPFLPWGQVQESQLAQSTQLALALQQQLAQINGVEVDPPATAPVRSLRNVNAPAVAIELGRLAPDEDSKALTNATFQQQVAAAVVQALAIVYKGATNP